MSQVTAKTVAFVPDITPCPNSDTEQANSVDLSEKSNEEEQHIFPGLYPVVFMCLKQESIPRIWCLRLVANPWFERMSMLVIMLNCVTLGLYQPCAHGEETACTTERCILLQFFDHFVFAFFAIEMLIKMLAMGIWGRLGYLGEAWNRLDCFIVICGMIEYTLQMEDSVNFTAVRTIRVLRPLRAINRVPSMRILVMLLLDTLPMLGNVLLLCSFVFFIFGVVAVQLWEGTLRQRCFLNSTYFDTSSDHVVLLQSNTSLNLNRFFSEHDHGGGATVCSLPYNNGELLCSDREIIYPNEIEGITCTLNISSYIVGNSPNTLYRDNSSINGTNCIDWNQYYDTCRASDQNPFQNAINFDNIMYAWVAIFQVISLEGWTDIMYYVMDGYSFYSFIYFIFLIVIGSFFMINLCLVVIATQFSETKQREQRLMEEQRLRFKSNDSTLASYAPPGNCYEETLKYISHLWRKNKRRLKRKWFNWRRSRSSKEETVGPIGHRSKKKKMIHFHHHHHHHHHHYHISDPVDTTVSIEVNRTSPVIDPTATTPRLMITDYDSESMEIPNLKNAIRLMIKSPSQPSSSTSKLSMSITPERRHSGDVQITSQTRGEVLFKMTPLTTGLDYLDVQNLSPPLFNAKRQSAYDDVIETDKRKSSARLSLPRGHVTSDLDCSCSAYGIRDANCFEPSAEDVIDQRISKRPRRSKCCSSCSLKSIKEKWRSFDDAISEISAKMKRIVDSRYFNRFIMIAILINTLSMGIEHHNQPKTLTDILEISNVVFTTLFALEMASKLIAYGILGYTKNLYNVFDAVVVIISVWEIVAGAENGGGLSVLRTFRLLRVLKLVRFLPALRRQLVVLMRTMDNVATFMMLLTLFIFIFSILGMHLFGCEFCWVDDHGITECDRKNFDSLLWAFVTVFQILTQEDWNIVLYNGMSSTTPFASIYFITLMTIGNYVLFNLLVAILVEGFQAECYPDPVVNDDSSNSDEEDKEDDDVTIVKQVGQEYTKKMADALGLKQPFPTYRHKKMTRKEHGASEAEEYNISISSSDSEEESEKEQEERRGEVACLLSKSAQTDSAQQKSSSYLTINQETTLPVITRTAATPLSTPILQFNPGWLGNKPRDKTADCFEKGDIQTTKRRLSFAMLSRKSSEESNLSVNSRELSRSGSKRLLKWKKIPLEEQSLVSNEGDSDGYCDNDDMYSNCSFDDSEEVVFDQASSRSNESSFHQIKTIESLKANSLESGNENIDNNPNGDKSKTCFSCWPEIQKFTKDRNDWSFYMFPPDSNFRKYLLKIVQSRIFDNIVLLFIFGNCVTIALERPSLDPHGQERYMIDFLNNVFTAVFTFELMLKVVAKGLYIGTHTYLKSGWNVLDFFLVTTSLVDIIMTLTFSGGSKLLGILRIFRLLRALRPLRVINRAPGLKLVVQTLISSLKPIGNIFLICCAFFIIFGILGVQVFKGKFYYCDGPYLRNITTYGECIQNPENKWLNQRYNFDDLGQALMSLFVLSSKDGWVEIMYHGIDAVGVNKQPQTNHNPWMLIYFISFLLIVGFFVLNMFVGVVVENFHRCREEHEQEEMKRRQELKRRKEEKLLQKQMMRRSLLESGEESSIPSKGRRKTLLQVASHVTNWKNGCSTTWKKWKSVISKKCFFKNDPNYYESYGRARRVLHNVCMSKFFEIGVSIIIAINIFTMGAEHYQQSELLTYILKYANYGFTAVFVLEAIFKMLALGVTRYFSDKWNQLDMLIVILSLVGIIFEDLSSGENQGLLINPTIIRVMRVLRIARVLKLLKISKGIRSLLETVACALPQVGNLGMLFLLLFFIFAALGVELFGTLVCDEEHPCEGLNRHATFNNFGIALLTLFRISTGDNWNGIMKDTLREDCDDGAECRINCCPNKIVSPVFFVVFVMMAQFVLVNVVVAVLMKQLEDSRAEASENGDESTNDNIQEVNEVDKDVPSPDQGFTDLKDSKSIPVNSFDSPNIVNSFYADVAHLTTINTPSNTLLTMQSNTTQEEQIPSTLGTHNFSSLTLVDTKSVNSLNKSTPHKISSSIMQLCSSQHIKRKNLSLPISDFSSTPLLSSNYTTDPDGVIPPHVPVIRAQSYDRNYSRPFLIQGPLIRRSSDSCNPPVPNQSSCHSTQNIHTVEHVTTPNKSLEQLHQLCNNGFKYLSDGFLNQSPKLSMKHPMFNKSVNVDLKFIDDPSPILIKKLSKSADKINNLQKTFSQNVTSLSGDKNITKIKQLALDIETSPDLKNKLKDPKIEDKQNSQLLISSEIRRKNFSTNVWPAIDKNDELQAKIV